MYGHVKPTVSCVSLVKIILHVGNNDVNFEETSNQIAKAIIDLAVLMKTNTNNISLSLITSESDHLNNKANEIYNRLINICGERHITVIRHSNTIRSDTQLNRSRLYLNKCGTN